MTWAIMREGHHVLSHPICLILYTEWCVLWKAYTKATHHPWRRDQLRQIAVAGVLFDVQLEPEESWQLAPDLFLQEHPGMFAVPCEKSYHSARPQPIAKLSRRPQLWQAAWT